MNINNLIGEATAYDKKLQLEVKRPKSWLKSVSAFANGEGGTLVFGISDDDQVVGLADAESDAIFAHLYGLTTEDLRYILDPEDVCGEGCINETFRVLKDNEIRQYGEYRTKRLVLDAWNRFGYDN